MFLAFIACGLGVILNSGLTQVNGNIISLIPVVNTMRILENVFYTDHWQNIPGEKELV